MNYAFSYESVALRQLITVGYSYAPRPEFIGLVLVNVVKAMFMT